MSGAIATRVSHRREPETHENPLSEGKDLNTRSSRADELTNIATEITRNPRSLRDSCPQGVEADPDAEGVKLSFCHENKGPRPYRARSNCDKREFNIESSGTLQIDERCANDGVRNREVFYKRAEPAECNVVLGI